MRSFVPDIELRAPSRLEETLELLDNGWQPMAGGTDMMVELEAGKLEVRRIAGLWNVNELRGIRREGGWLSVGATVTYTELRESAEIGEHYALLAQAAACTGGIATQNRGTLGGNIGNASPAADSLPVLLVYDAELEIASRRAVRRIPYAKFHTGYKRKNLAPGELITRILLPARQTGWQECFRKVGTRAAQAISKVAMAAAARVANGRIDDIRIAYASVAPVPLRCHQTELALRGARLAELPELPDETTPIDDIRSTARYRRQVARNLLVRFLAGLK
ncbi:MAG: FAD binding domain-containing protein [Bryobacterales bacterium]|nr:FAD binding domain-containing protein [Bryobacterales bacterium]